VRQFVGDTPRDVEAIGKFAIEPQVGSAKQIGVPQRSPSPFSVPWIWRAPERTAAHEWPYACSVSL